MLTRCNGIGLPTPGRRGAVWRRLAGSGLAGWALAIAGGAVSSAVAMPTPAVQESPARAPATETGSVPIVPGSGWSRSANVAPGTILELAGPGVHVPAVLEGLRGRDDAPIVVRRAIGAPSAPFVVGGETGLLLRDCEHVVVEEIAFIGATRCGIRIENCRSIAVRNVLVARLGPDADADGFEIVDSTGIDLRTVRFDGWQDAGLELRGAREIRGGDLQFTPLVRHRNLTAIRVGADCRDVRFSEFTTRAIPTAVEIGIAADLPHTPDTPEASEPADSLGDGATAPSSGTADRPVASTSPPRAIVLERALLDRPDVALRLLDAVEVDLRRLTIVDSKVVFEIDAKGLEAARFADNLVVWNPGAMRAFAEVVRGDEGLELGGNLWWSAELPAARPLLGDLPGRAATPQRFSPDPRVAPRGHPTAPEAEGFGRPAPERP